MTGKHNILLSIIFMSLMVLFFYIIFGEHGYSDLANLRQEQEQSKSVQKNERLSRENLAFRIEIDRLKHDLDYIENIARQELGMIKKDEIILKPKNGLDQKK